LVQLERQEVLVLQDFLVRLERQVQQVPQGKQAQQEQQGKQAQQEQQVKSVQLDELVLPEQQVKLVQQGQPGQPEQLVKSVQQGQQANPVQQGQQAHEAQQEQQVKLAQMDNSYLPKMTPECKYLPILQSEEHCYLVAIQARTKAQHQQVAHTFILMERVELSAQKHFMIRMEREYLDIMLIWQMVFPLLLQVIFILTKQM